MNSEAEEFFSRVEENKKYTQLSFSNMAPTACFEPTVGFNSQKRVADIDVENQLFGFGSPLSSVKSVKPEPNATVSYSSICTPWQQNHTRSVKERIDDPKTKNVSNYFQQILPFDVQKHFLTFNYYNSRQAVKDIKEKELKKRIS